MRRPLLAAAILVPAAAVLARIDTAPSGKVVERDNYNLEDATSYISAAQCEGTAPLDLQWSTVVTGGGGDWYTLFASSAAPAASGTDANYCPESDVTGGNGTADVFAGEIPGGGAWVANIQTANPQPTGKDAVDVTGKTCTEGAVLYICAHLRDGGAGGTRVGYASGKFVVQVAKPARPTGVQAWPADADALVVRWTRNTTGVEVDYYVATATPVGGGEPVPSEQIRSGSEAIIDNLPPGEYRVVVYAYSFGGNQSDPSLDDVTATPGDVDDFWDAYRRAGGQEQGGCGSGGTGPLALLSVALLALLRRRA